MGLFYLLRSMMLAITFPHNTFTNNFFCFNLPRYLYLSSWQLFHLWLHMSLIRRLSPRHHRIDPVSIVFIVVNISSFVLSLITSIIVSTQSTKSTQTPVLSHINNSLVYVVILVLMLYYAILLSRAIKRAHKIPALRWRLIVLLILTLSLSVLHIFRCAWNMTSIFKKNYIKNQWDVAFAKCVNHDENCSSWYNLYSWFYVIVDVMPGVLLLGTCVIISFPASQTAQRQKKPAELTTSTAATHSKSVKKRIRVIDSDDSHKYFEGEDQDADQTFASFQDAVYEGDDAEEELEVLGREPRGF
ncbi:hypothetical protein BLNAU_3338 [Blattamonas nauphoetae]|uniref:Uncharacterized protein n=1 Tax=Blattamonas nauphoetae TaxID=2049346 RepID=A0ABQ9YCQ2_9EUKA|nr:hypothetical protein BLNAU_3338 [Blattamonas nauphoetae]